MTKNYSQEVKHCDQNVGGQAHVDATHNHRYGLR